MLPMISTPFSLLCLLIGNTFTGVLCSFYGRLFPKSSIYVMYSSFALHWLSKVPKELLDNGSLAWNKGKIHYTSASKEITNVYAAQFAKDMDTFFNVRADVEE
ncbi:Loganic acid O-methyltransferase [Camellia lanceoleosa]|uniref:Loganic acid O-methyltransferase n=1 Tax=Camellia lanceoleosa TaxID=1840588 RepID=A0ACC0IE36_9ERIC|nr:Loganic acid O-methyltransferase [Camellia lanceoleosa]